MELWEQFQCVPCQENGKGSGCLCRVHLLRNPPPCFEALSTIVEFSASTSSQKKKRQVPTAGTDLVNKVHQVVNISFLGLGSNICNLFPPADLKCLLCARPGLF